MNITGIMQRAFARDWIKSAGVGITDILDFPGQGGNCLIQRQTDNPGKYVPSCTTGCASLDLNGGYPAMFHFHTVFRQTKLPAVFACSPQAAQSASGKRCHRAGVFFAGGNDRNIFIPAHLGKMG